MRDDDIDPTFRDALEWFVRLRDERSEPGDFARFETWRSADRSHAEAFAKAEAFWARFDPVKPEYDRFRRRRRLTRRGLLGIASLAMLGGPAAYLAARPGSFADYRTDVAERRAIALDDGSSVELGTDTALSVDFDAGKRRLVLYRGEAFFHVAPDPARPFVVEAGAGSVRALGTQFDLRLDETTATVAVLEHAVDISTAEGSDLIVEAGWQASYDNSGVARPRRFDANVAQAWRRDRIVFEDVPLRRVLAELERYRRGPILLMGKAAGDITVTAIFDTKDSEGALRTIERTVPVRILTVAGYGALVYPR